MLVAMSFLNHFNRTCMTVAGTERLMPDYDIDEVSMGWVYTALLIAYTACMTPGGWYSDRWGGKLALVTMGFGSALCVALTGVVGFFTGGALLWPALMVVRAGTGALSAPLYPAGGRIVTRWVPFRRRAFANAVVISAAPAGVASAYPVFAALIDRAGWQNAFVITGVFTALLTLVWTWDGRNSPAEHPGVNPQELAILQGPTLQGSTTHGSTPHGPIPAESVSSPRNSHNATGSWRSVLANRSVWLLTGSYAAMGYVEYLVFYWLEYYFKEVLQFSETESRYSAMAPPIAMAVSMPLGGWLADRLVAAFGYRWGRAAVGLIGMSACATFLWLGTAVSGGPAIVTCFSLALVGVGISEAAAWATAIDLGGERGGTSAAIVNTGGNGLGLVSPVVTPWVSALLAHHMEKAAAWSWGVRLGCVICALGAVFWFWIDAGERRE